jgi:hypothetical protein
MTKSGDNEVVIRVDHLATRYGDMAVLAIYAVVGGGLAARWFRWT